MSVISKNSKIRRWVLAGTVVGALIVLFYPRKVTLVPEMKLTVAYDGGEIVRNGEVSRNWNHYLGDGWKATVLKTDDNGMVRFKSVTTRVPLILQGLKIVVSPIAHYYPGLAGSITGRDTNNHLIFQRVDFNDSNCCPEQIVISLHLEDGEGSDKYFTFGDVVPNE